MRQALTPKRIFILSPARLNGERAALICNPRARFELAHRLQRGEKVPVRDIFAFLSGLYFRGKAVYAKTFAQPPAGMGDAWVITSNKGLVELDFPISLRQLLAFSNSEIDLKNPDYVRPFLRHARRLKRNIDSNTEVVLLGSISTPKYVQPLLATFGEQLRFPIDFVGRGDMSRGSLLLRAAFARQELEYVPLAGAKLRGKRPPKLEPRRWPREQMSAWFGSCVLAVKSLK